MSEETHYICEFFNNIKIGFGHIPCSKICDEQTNKYKMVSALKLLTVNKDLNIWPRDERG